ncbi:uncharacterized protein LOC131940412 [Physella acuta]|uniref:uncharacterized protein LOC131940412 n=1 Tax=Physella acuta TaxID=109671 RepID=UPI0027DDAC73|nr:uncharacterized protein LOC131940412 [Physella acuta]
MAITALIGLVLLCVAPSFQQPGFKGGPINHGNCYDRCLSAYQRNPNAYFVAGCICNQYDFKNGVPIDGGHIGGGHIGGIRGNCGYLAPNCRASPGEYNAVYRYTYDNQLKTCVKVFVYNSCASSYGVASNFFLTQLECSQACEYNNRKY